MVCPFSRGLSLIAYPWERRVRRILLRLEDKLVLAGGGEQRAGNARQRLPFSAACWDLDRVAQGNCAPHKPTSRTLVSDFRCNTRKATCGHSEHVFKWRSSWRGPVESITISSAFSSNIRSPSSLSSLVGLIERSVTSGGENQHL